MTNLLIAYPDIPFRAKVSAAPNSFTVAADCTERNLIYGPRWQCMAGTPTGGAGSYLTWWDLGAGNSSNLFYIIVPRADRLIAQGFTHFMVYSSAGAIYSGLSSQYDWTLTSETLYGPRSNDFIKTGLGPGLQRTWAIGPNYPTAASYLFLHKIYCGSPFDMGVEPEYAIRREPRALSNTKSDSGARYVGRIDETAYSWDFTWKGVSDATTKSFFETIVKYKHRHRFFLYTATNHRILNDLRCVHVKLDTVETLNSGLKQNWNEISATFIEEVG